MRHLPAGPRLLYCRQVRKLQSSPPDAALPGWDPVDTNRSGSRVQLCKDPLALSTIDGWPALYGLDGDDQRPADRGDRLEASRRMAEPPGDVLGPGAVQTPSDRRR